MNLRNLVTTEEFALMNAKLTEELVFVTSKVISDSCIPDNHNNRYLAFVLGSTFADDRFVNPMLSGSTGEMYINPRVPCTGDIDIMKSFGNAIVVENDHLEFPETSRTCFQERVNCLKICPVEDCPAYVRMILLGQFRFCWDSEKYVFHKDDSSPPKRLYLSTFPTADNQMMHVSRAGPAAAIEYKQLSHINRLSLENIMPANRHQKGGYHVPMDSVLSYPFPFWPTLASEWVRRHRPNGWPSRDTLHKVVRGGCDIVEASHPSHREDDSIMRISFSRAEIVLIRSWTHTQQVAFHLLRYFAKKELMFKDWQKQDKILCTYHMKTLMLWSCEARSRDFWDGCVVDIVCALLPTLSDWLKAKECRNYFIPSSNLFVHIQNEDNLQEVITKLAEFQSNHTMADWLMKNYIKESCSSFGMIMVETMKLCLGPSSAETQRMLESTAFAMDRFHQDNEKKKEYYSNIGLFVNFFQREPIHKSDANMPICVSRKDVYEIGETFADHLAALHILHLVKYIEHGSISPSGYEISDYIGTLFKRFDVHNLPLTYGQCLPDSRLYLVKAEEIMSGLGVAQTDSEIELMTRLAVQCLQKSLNHLGSRRDSVYNTAVVYLAALLFYHRQYADVIALCAPLLDRNSTECSDVVSGNDFQGRKVDSRLMIFIPDLSHVVGTITLYAIAKKIDLWKTYSQLFEVSPEILALYLMMMCQTEMSFEVDESQLFTKSETVIDAYLMSLIVRKGKTTTSRQPSCVSQDSSKFETLAKLPEPELTQLLMSVALKRLQKAFDSVRNDFKSICPMDMQLEALYLYRCKRFDEVMMLCQKLDAIEDFHHELHCYICQETSRISTSAPVDLFYDDDIQSIHGLGQLFKSFGKTGRNPFRIYVKRSDPNPPMSYIQAEEATEKEFWGTEKATLHRKFLAKYLKLRCLIDTNRSLDEIKEVYREIEKEKLCYFPINQAVLHFMHEKIRRLQR